MRVKLDTPLSLREISLALGTVTKKDIHISAITTDTREAQSGDLFIALSGENDNGEKYIEAAKEMECTVLSTSTGKDVVTVDDTAMALLRLSEYYKSKLCVKHTVAVTGSVGKSTTVKFISKILKEKYRTHSPNGNYNNHIGVPLTVFSTPKDTEVLIVELGMNHKNEISKLSRCVHPTVSVITSVGTAHLGNLGTREDIAKAKLEILDGMSDGVLLVPENEPLLKNLSGAACIGRNSSLSSFSLNDAGDYYSFRTPNGNIDGIEFFDKREHLLIDLSFALSIASLLGLSENEIRDGVRAINESDIRQRFISIGDFTIFDDSYNASLESVIADFKYISAMNRSAGAFLGDIFELGESAREIHEKIGEAAARLGILHLYLIGEYASYTRFGAIRAGMCPSHIFVNKDISNPSKSIEQILLNHSPGEIILFKASHKMRLDKIADTMKKG